MQISVNKDLRDGKPVWLDHPSLVRPTPGSVPVSTDIVIVGTGVSGALVADSLQRAGYSVVALDRRTIMSGSTPASTALLQSELDVPLVHLKKMLGKRDAARAWTRSSDAIHALKARIEDLKIACDFRDRDTIYLPGNVLDVAGLKEECAAREELGLRSHHLTRQELLSFSGLGKPGALITRGNAEVNPVKLVAGLWNKFKSQGGQIFAHSEVVEVAQTRSRVRITLADGSHITAKHAVFCTGYEILPRLRPKGYKITSTWVLATKPQPRNLWKTASLIWEASDPYLYLRSTADGRIIAGGEDEEFENEEKRNALTAKKVEAIRRKAAKLWPKADFSPAFSWTGCFGESPHGLPAIGRVPGLPRCYTVLGFGGNGITFSMLAAQLISRDILGIADPDASLFKL